MSSLAVTLSLSSFRESGVLAADHVAPSVERMMTWSLVVASPAMRCVWWAIMSRPTFVLPSARISPPFSQVVVEPVKLRATRSVLVSSSHMPQSSSLKETEARMTSRPASVLSTSRMGSRASPSNQVWTPSESQKPLRKSGLPSSFSGMRLYV